MTIYRLVETAGDIADLTTWARGRTVALDTETTGLDIYSKDWRLHTVQVADASGTAWIVQLDSALSKQRGPVHPSVIHQVIEAAEIVVMHNAIFFNPPLC